MTGEREFSKIKKGSRVEDVVRGAYLEGGRVHSVTEYDGGLLVERVEWVREGSRTKTQKYSVDVRDGVLERIDESGACLCETRGFSRGFFDKEATLEGTF